MRSIGSVAWASGALISAFALFLTLNACGVLLLGDDDDTDVNDGAAPDTFIALEAASGAEGSVAPGGDGGGANADGQAIFPCPAACNGGCETGECVIVCLGDDTLDGGDAFGRCASPITCPPGVPCHVKCLGAGGPCLGKAVSCSSASQCAVDCLGDNACNSASIECGFGPCSVTCGESGHACDSTQFAASHAKSLCQRCLVKEACINLGCALGSGVCSRVCEPADSCKDVDLGCPCNAVPTCP